MFVLFIYFYYGFVIITADVGVVMRSLKFVVTKTWVQLSGAVVVGVEVIASGLLLFD